LLISWQVGFFGGGFLTTEVIVKKDDFSPGLQTSLGIHHLYPLLAVCFNFILATAIIDLS
jgi:hypothetical protein